LAVEAALQTVPKTLHGPLKLAFEEVLLDFAPPPDREELERTAATEKQPASGHARRLLKELAETGKIRAGYPCPIQVVRFGDDLTLVAIGGEVVVDYSLRLKRELAGPAVWVAGYSNDVFTYVPSVRVLKEGGYEASVAVLWGSLTGPFTESIEDRIVGKVLELAKRK
jgi:O-phosphoseryl-tRNA(Cys) synthetase